MKPPLGTVMVIDDEELDQRQYRRILSRSGLTRDIIQFTYADEALEWLLSSPDPAPDLILLDINIPRMNGFEFLAALKNAVGEPSSPVIIMLTTSLSPDDQARASAFASVRGYFHKPLTEAHLAEAVEILKSVSAA
ncbi:response regulator [Aliishimia ponticola]|uniref:Response regulator n=1 Tax=Aliishimia ponticola TaxID=2499833 RepID=A0A4S4NGN3_9RHOB|nr:response regulator [Aliishimia ponticola]THH38802.1 response regulator [Aliishimia ponticola]